MQQQVATSDTDINSSQNANLNTESSETQSPHRCTSYFSFVFKGGFKENGMVQKTMMQFNQTALLTNEKTVYKK